MRNILTKIFAVMALSVMTIAAMATTVSIPTTSGYVAWSDAVLENSNTCNDGKGIENTNTSTKATFTLNNATEQVYYISMRTTANNVTAVFSVTIKKGDDVVFTTNRNVEDTRGWYLDHYSVTPTQHKFCVGTLPVGTLTLEIAGVSSSASSIGNYGFMTILSASEYDNIPGSITLENGVYNGPKLENSNTNVGFVENDGTAQYTFINTTAGVYKMTMDIYRYNIGGTMNIKVVDGQSGATEVNYDYTIASDAPGSYTSTDILLPADITTGIKTMTFTFSNGSSYICNYKTPTFTKMYDHMAKVSSISISGQTVTTGATSDWYCALPVSYDANTTFGVSASNGTIAVTAKDESNADVAVTDNGDGTYTIATPALNTTTTVSVALTANSDCLAEKATYTFKIYRIGEISLTAVTVDGVAVDVLTEINTGDGYTATVMNCYTSVPTVAAVQVDEANATVDTPSISGSTYTYTIHGSMAGGSITRDYTLVLNNVHVYAPTGDEDAVNIKNNEGERADGVWTNGIYTLSTTSLDGYNQYFKMNGDNYTLSLPADVVVKQLILKECSNNYAGNDARLVSVSSTGATAYVPVENKFYHDSEGAKHDIVVTIDGHSAGNDISFSMPKKGQPMCWIQLTTVKSNPGTAPVKTSDNVVYDDNDAVVAVSFDRVIANDVTATIGGNSVKAKGGATTLYFPVWDLAYSSSNTLSIAAEAVEDNYGNKNASAINIAVNIPAKTAVTPATYDYVVSSVSEFLEAVTAVNASNNSASAARKTIFIKNGDYDFGDATGDGQSLVQVKAYNVSFIGESRDGVILHGNDDGISNPVLNLRDRTGFYLQDLTVRNDRDYGNGLFDGGVAVAIYGGDKTIMKNVRMLSNQDTQVTGHRAYFEDCEIHGTVDFICGGGDNYYYHTDLVLENRGGNCITAPSTNATHQWGYVFDHCTIKGVDAAAATTNTGSYTLGRPWQNEPRAYYLHTAMTVPCATGGWAGMSHLPTHFYEYDSRDADNNVIDLSGRTNSSTSTNSYTPILTDEQAAEFTVHNVLGGTDAWDAAALAAQVSAPVNIAAHGYELTWNAVEDASLYAVFKDGEYIANVTSTFYTASETGLYTVKAANRFGGLGAASVAVEVTGMSYERAFAHMQLNTLCFPYQIDSYTGATFYTLTYKVTDGENVTEVILDEHEGTLEAGYPYFYIPEAGYNKLVCSYSGSNVAAQNDNGVYGSFEDNATVPANSYVTYNGQVRKIGSSVTLGEYRAYIKMDEVNSIPTPAQVGRRRLAIRNADAPAGTTDIENTLVNHNGSQKVLRNGQFFIIRDGKTYNAQGLLLNR